MICNTIIILYTEYYFWLLAKISVSRRIVIEVTCFSRYKFSLRKFRLGLIVAHFPDWRFFIILQTVKSMDGFKVFNNWGSSKTWFHYIWGLKFENFSLIWRRASISLLSIHWVVLVVRFLVKVILSRYKS